VALAKTGTLERFGVERSAPNLQADPEGGKKPPGAPPGGGPLFSKGWRCERIGVAGNVSVRHLPPSLEEAERVGEEIGTYPRHTSGRPFTLGGSVGGIAYNRRRIPGLLQEFGLEGTARSAMILIERSSADRLEGVRAEGDAPEQVISRQVLIISAASRISIRWGYHGRFDHRGDGPDPHRPR